MKQVKIISIENTTHNVAHITTEKPQNLEFLPGQAVDVAIKKPSWENELRPFTFTSLPTDNHLEFFIKVYPEH
ncbi:FAD-binding oxidoreductase [Xanthomarina sp. F2636L]|uniref:FAD-binding oxidoreductase n=1 Tax=Xanthomarina sp. F2636L TaxID=2996018 RepID=UPI00225DFC3C|nr:FAD-binding oxidoreductase [Xanthomarina sp. F2636L]MCX7549985.1 FAD-binding oxidoreductase [Xanthomarina sp. F2636L]